MNPQRLLIIIGIGLLVVGLLWPYLGRLPIGRLPGDLVFRRGGFVFYAPLMTGLIVSVVLSLLLWVFRR